MQILQQIEFTKLYIVKVSNLYFFLIITYGGVRYPGLVSRKPASSDAKKEGVGHPAHLHSLINTFEQCHEKTNILHMQKQRRRSASR